VDEVALIRDTMSYHAPVLIAPLSIQFVRAGVQGRPEFFPCGSPAGFFHVGKVCQVTSTDDIRRLASIATAPDALGGRCRPVARSSLPRSAPQLSSLAEQLAVMYVTQARPLFEIFVREGNGSCSEQQS
jgi:hypothetical protein